jgi:uncharacterized membrane protein
MISETQGERTNLMSKGRMEAFSDGVIAIIITIMVLELKVPHGSDITALAPMIPVFLSYVLSFAFLGIYWNNHHHLLQAVRHVNGRVLWANMHLLFWLSLIPVTTAWMGENHIDPWPAALYGIVLLCAAFSYYFLARSLASLHGRESVLALAMGSGTKERISLTMYCAAVPLAFVSPWISLGLYAGVAIIWLIPDRRIEKTLSDSREHESSR